MNLLDFVARNVRDLADIWSDTENDLRFGEAGAM